MTEEDRASAPRPPKTLVAVAAVVAILGCGMSIAGAITTGLSSDEPTHVKRLSNFQDTGMFALTREILETPGAIPDRAYVYAPTTARLQHGANVLAGNDVDRLSRTPRSYMVRHLVVATIALAGLLAVGVIASLLLGEWRWGLVASAALVAIPMWTGHSMFNPKDVSVATGYTVMTLGLILLARKSSNAPRDAWVAGATFTCGTVLMVGTRPGMWIALVGSIAVLVAAMTWARAFARGTLLTLSASVLASYLALLAIYPRVFANPGTALWKSAVVSSNFERVRTTASTRGYVVAHTLQEWPTILLALLFVGSAVAIVMTVNHLRTRSVTVAGILLVGSQAFALSLIAIIRDSNLYNGLRQLLFAVPAQAILVTIGLAWIFTAARSSGRRTVVAAVASLGLLLPTAAQAAMFPFQYATINVAAQALGVQADTDYWDTSFRALRPAVSGNLKVLCPHFSGPEFFARTRADCRNKEGGTFSPFWLASGEPALDLPKGNEYEALVRGTVPLPDYCHTIHRLTRWQNYERVTISRVVLCDPPDTRRNTTRHDVVNPWDPGWAG